MQSPPGLPSSSLSIARIQRRMHTLHLAAVKRCGEQQKCKRANDEPREEHTGFSSFPAAHCDLMYFSFTVLFSRGVQHPLIAHLWLSPVEPNHTPCLGSILHSAFKGQGLPASGGRKKVNFQRQNCSFTFIPPPMGVNIKLFQVC